MERIGDGALGEGEGARYGGEGGRLEAVHGRRQHRVFHRHELRDERVERAGDVDRAAEFEGLTGQCQGPLLDVACQSGADARLDVAGGATDQVDGVFVGPMDEAVGVPDLAVVGRGGGAGVDGGRADHQVAGVGIQIDDGKRRSGQEVG